MREWLVRIWATLRAGTRDRAVADEIAFHLDELARRFEARGLNPSDARRAAERELGGVGRTMQAWRDQRRWPPLEELLQDVRHAGRVLRQTPALTLTAGLMLSTAVAATTSVFSVVDAVLLAPLPYGDARQLVTLNENYLTLHAPTVSVAPGNFLEWRTRCRSCAAMTAIDQRDQNITSEDPQHVTIAGVSEDFAATIDRRPRIGRLFTADEFQPGRDSSIILGYSLWQSRYGGDPAVLGRTVHVDEQPYTVVGVMPAGFIFPEPAAQAWVPRPTTAADRENRTGHSLLVVARIRNGVTIGQATRELDAIAQALRHEHPDANGEWAITVRPARDALLGPTRTVVAAIMGAVVFLLLIACANIAGLLLAHGMARSREMAIRAALGASRRRLVRQLLTESITLAIASGAVGVAAAWALQPVLARLRPSDFLAWKPIAIDLRSMAFALGSVVGAAVVFGTLPAIVGSRGELMRGVSERTPGPASARIRQTLVAFEITLAMVLVLGAALVGKTLVNLTHVDLGFATRDVVALTLTLPTPRYADRTQVMRFLDDTLARIRALPGVRAAGSTQAAPLSGNTSVRPYRIFGFSEAERAPVAHYRIVTPGYFDALRIRLVAGRVFAPADTAARPLVVVINETLRKQAFGDRDPIGHRIWFGGSSEIWGEIVGVVGDVRHFGPAADVAAEMYWPAAQIDVVGSTTLDRLRRQVTVVIAADGDPLAIVPAAREAVRAVDPLQPVAEVRTMTSLVGASMWLARASTCLLVVLGSAAAAFALLGVFAAASYSVVQRRRELAIRLAVGAAPRTVALTVIGGAAVAAALGVGAGVGLTAAFGRGVASLLVGVQPNDPLTIASVAVALIVATLAACWPAARRAARVDPVEALRVE